MLTFIGKFQLPKLTESEFLCNLLLFVKHQVYGFTAKRRHLPALERNRLLLLALQQASFCETSSLRVYDEEETPTGIGEKQTFTLGFAAGELL